MRVGRTSGSGTRRCSSNRPKEEWPPAELSRMGQQRAVRMRISPIWHFPRSPEDREAPLRAT